MLINIKFSIGIYTVGEEVREVIIASPEKLFFPDNIESIIINSLEERLRNNIEFSEGENKFKKELGTEAGDIPGSIIGENLSINKFNIKNVKDISDNITFGSDLPSRFSLGSPLESKLNLSRYSAKKESLIYEIERGNVKKDLDLSKYLFSDFSNIRSIKSKASYGRYVTGSTSHRGITSSHVVEYDVIPWAIEVVDRIQKNWIIPPEQKTRAKGQVGIYVIIQKNGEVSSVEIVNSSNVEMLDQDALKAINWSSPFPKLPDDFPEERLEVYFVFSIQ